MDHDDDANESLRKPQFANRVEEFDAASEASGGPKREVRARINTGFVKDEGAVAEETSRKPLRFDGQVEEFEAATESSGAPMRQRRARMNTGFAKESGIGADGGLPKMLNFVDKVEEVDAASEATGGPKRNVRARITTGFAINEGDAGQASSRMPIRFVDQAEEMDAASEASGGPKREVRARIGTGFANDDSGPGADKLRKPLRFVDQAEELDAATEATDKPKGLAMTRINTGFVSGVDDSVEEPSRKPLFDSRVEEFEAASEASGVPKREVRARINTGFVKDEGLASEESSRKLPRFAHRVEEFDAASEASGDAKGKAMARVNTGFEASMDDDADNILRKPLFASRVEELDAASEARGGPKRDVRARINTGFANADGNSDGDDRRKPLQFDGFVEEFDAASEASGVPKREARARINTGFAKDGGDSAENNSRNSLQFAGRVEEYDAASEASGGPKRETRARINTGFAKNDSNSAEDDSRKPLQFAGVVEEFDAASEASGGPKREARARINTGFVKDNGDTSVEASRKPLQFAGLVEEFDAASEGSGGPKRDARARINTGYEKDAVMPLEPNTNSVLHGIEEQELAGIFMKHFKEKLAGLAGVIEGQASREIEVMSKLAFAAGRLSAAKWFSESMPGLEEVEQFLVKCEEQLRDFRPELRIDEVSSQQLPAAPLQRAKHAHNDKALKFSSAVESCDAASEAAGHAKREVRSRVKTGFENSHSADDIMGGPRKPRFSDAIERVVSAQRVASKIHRRLKTCFIEGDAGVSKDEKNVQFAGVSCQRFDAEQDMEEPARKRTISFSEQPAHELDAASQASTTPRQVRGRMSTGYLEAEDAGASSESDSESDSDEDEDSVPRMRTFSSSTRDSLKLTHRSSTRNTLCRQLIAKSRLLQKTRIGGSIRLAADEDPLAMLRVQSKDAEVEEALLLDALRSLAIFEDTPEHVMKALVEFVEVCCYSDGDWIIREGDQHAVHFFVACRGAFEILNGDKVVAELTRGATFGHSVLFADGVRKASVRAKGSSQVYALKANDVRDVLRFAEDETRQETITVVDKIVETGRCPQLHDLNIYQLNKLYDECQTETFENGAVIFQAGPISCDEVRVLWQGAAKFREEEGDVKRVANYAMFGLAAVLFGQMQYSVVADGMAKTLRIPRHVLEDVFGGASRLTRILLQSEVSATLCNTEELSGLHEGQLEKLASSFRTRLLQPGELLSGQDLRLQEQARLILCLDGVVEVSHDGSKDSDDQNLCCQLSAFDPAIGGAQFLTPEIPWNCEVRCASSGRPATLAIWSAEDAQAIMAERDIQAKLSVLRSAFLFKTLSAMQLKQLAMSMVGEQIEDGAIVVKQGDVGDTFHIIGFGRVSIVRNEQFLRTMSQGDFFGERALLTHEPRSATVTASGPCLIWTITAETFSSVMPQETIDYLRGRNMLYEMDLDFNDMIYMRTIGEGAFGVVKMVKTKKTGNRFALKCVKKQNLLDGNQRQWLLNELGALSVIDHPFIVRLVQCFRNEAFVYFLQELIPGGELLEALAKLGILNKSQAAFYTGSVVLALKHLHERKIAYLDLKSENVLIDSQGYIKLVDFGLAERTNCGLLYVVKGTPQFMAPEMIRGRGYTSLADFWSLGVCLYEFMVGELPFGKDLTTKSEIVEAVLKAPLIFPEHFRAQPWFPESSQLMEGLLTRNPSRRLGSFVNGMAAIMEHPFFSNFSWDDLLARRTVPPYVPRGEHYETGDENASGAGRSLAEVEAEAGQEVLATGWKDPDPGWDDDFS
eukprot:TRINITY_DN3796_c0_g1_i2.p1 TRINITY_DN3796_c0_g1~~TRINITY_DN3796_c0_g1_i2.p1  ORF type:complete len:2012 (-),score=446.48 TRINITY_DN3796_c0_g1_i2:41-5329(-)